MHKKYTYEEVKEIADRYDTLAEFTKRHVGAYECALNNGWLADFTHLKRKRVHTVESVLAVCNKFNSYKEFISYDATIYQSFSRMYKRGQIKDEDLPWKVTRRTNKWTYDACYKEAKKYRNRWEFKKGCDSAYNASRKNKWLDDYTWFYKRKSKYTYEICKELASKFKSRAEFQSSCGGAYCQAARKGWIDDFNFEESKLKWNKENIIAECNKYKTKTNLFNNNEHAYHAYIRFKRKGLISDDDIKWEKSIRSQGDETERIHHVYVYDFGNNVAYVGRTCDVKKRDKQHHRPHHAHGKVFLGSVLKYSIESGIEIPKIQLLESELTLQESCKQEDFWLNEYKRKGYTMLNRGVTGEFVGSIGGFKQKWTKERVVEVAKQFDNYTELCKIYRSMPYLLKKFGVIDELFPNRLRAHKFTLEEIQSIASQYPTRTRFAKLSPKHHYVAHKNGWLDILFPKPNDKQQ